jgi:hypothetical protein
MAAHAPAHQHAHRPGVAAQDEQRCGMLGPKRFGIESGCGHRATLAQFHPQQAPQLVEGSQLVGDEARRAHPIFLRFFIIASYLP